jgi:hypothetical protein
VDGNFSVFKKMFPKDFTEIKDIPGYTTAEYSAVGMDQIAGEEADKPKAEKPEEVLAGEPAMNRPGAQAEIFFPHLGSIQEYFLYGIQKALRPFSGTLATGSATPGDCQINCNENIPDNVIPDKFLGSYKEAFIDKAERWTGDGKSHARECYNDVVRRSLSAGVNPAFTLMIWANESGASNYTAHNTSCETQDFGINNPAIASDFNSQLTRFLRLPSAYKSQYPQCFNYPGANEMKSFLHIFRSGVNDPCRPNQDSIDYYNAIQPVWGWVAPGCSFPTYPTDESCP